MLLTPNFMKNYYIIYFFIASSFAINAQTNCDQANSYLVSAYSHLKDAYDSNNISHLKYYANRSVESFKLSKNTLINCGCETALVLVNKGIDLLAKVENPKFEIIFVTAFDEYAIEAIQHCAIGYLVKPFDNKENE